MPSGDANELTLRPFVETDEDTVNGWFADAGELRFFAGRRLSWPPDRRQWLDIRADPAVTAWTAVLPGSDVPLGHGELVVASETAVRLVRLAVSPDARGRGIGREIVTQLVEKGRLAGYSSIMLEVHRDNTTAIRGYRGIGFVTSDDLKDNSNIRMELSLQGS